VTLWAYPMDSTGCGMYRVVWPLEALAEHRGLDWEMVPPGGDEGIGTRLDSEGHVTHIQVPEGCTGLFVQRPTSELLVETLTKLKRKLDMPLLVDVDDDLSSLSARHPAFHHLHPNSASRMPGHTASAVHQACDLADVVIASTPALLERYVRRGQLGVVLENRLPRHLVPAIPPPHPNTSSHGGLQGGREAPSHTDPRVGPHAPPIGWTEGDEGLVHPASVAGRLRVGWPASIITHPDDLLPALSALHRNQVQPLWCLGPHPEVGRRINPRTRKPEPYRLAPHERRRLPYTPMVFSGPTDFPNWISHIRQHLDIALCPLEPTTFNAAKSWLKPLECAAALTPFIASDTSEYRRLGAGLLANKKTWHRHLRLLLNDPDARQEERERNTLIAQANTYDSPASLDGYAKVFQPWMTPHVHDFTQPPGSLEFPQRCRCGTPDLSSRRHAAARAERSEAPSATLTP